MAVEPLGVSLLTWAGLFGLGGVAGLVLHVVANPQGSALPRFAPHAKWLNLEARHFLYAGLAAVMGAAFITLWSFVVPAPALAAVWLACLLAAAWFGNDADRRKAALVAHAKVIGGLALLLAIGYAITEFVVLG